MPSENQSLYISVQQVAKRYGVGIATVWRWAARGELPAPIVLGRRATRWSVAELDAHDATLAAARSGEVAK